MRPATDEQPQWFASTAARLTAAQREMAASVPSPVPPALSASPTTLPPASALGCEMGSLEDCAFRVQSLNKLEELATVCLGKSSPVATAANSHAMTICGRPVVAPRYIM